MPNYGSACRGCSGEDCPCCEVFLEAKADMAADRDREEFEAFTDENCDDSMDGDFDSGMASAGMGMDEDYNHYEYDTPLGMEMDGGGDEY